MNKKSLIVATLDSLRAVLADGRYVALSNDKIRRQEILQQPEWHTVYGYTDRELVDDLLEKADEYKVRKGLCMFPGCAVGWYVFQEDNAYCLKYEVKVVYVNRPTEPLEF